VLLAARRARSKLYWGLKSRFGSVPDGIRLNSSQWDAEYAAGDWERLDAITEVAHYMVILGFLDYAVPSPTVLDIGCGHGRLTRLLARFGFADYLGVDISAEAVQRAQSLAIPNTRFAVADMNHWDTTERFDVVVLNESLYYSENPRDLFERAVSWLTREGVVIVSTFRQSPGTRRIWSQVEAVPTEPLAACSVTDHATWHTWDLRVMRRRGW
jgi:2-polyprenyl-3-methyl-5-hydroxy-6-metoxy-1,4-benzoquinol methylase